MPILKGYELRSKLKTDEELNLQCIPYLFFFTAINQRMVVDAYSASVKVFVKQTWFDQLVNMLR
ncbi:hypothetical protein IEE83_17680 [Dyadobacter sp. UP-52]|uniref:Uncharacterized protein n=1 Tax=Dyadobacter subterraneus TaxID=2773304 RepID=A0ABR9WDY7_9BACT|nr:hypothetical protein [Dyadobacter subterraneus]